MFFLSFFEQFCVQIDFLRLVHVIDTDLFYYFVSLLVQIFQHVKN